MPTKNAKNVKNAKNEWKGRPKIILRPAQPERAVSGEFSQTELRINLDRTVYRNRLVTHFCHQMDEMHHLSFHTLNLTFYHTKDQVYGLTIGQLEELIYTLSLLLRLQHQLSRNDSTQAARHHRCMLKKFQKGLVIE